MRRTLKSVFALLAVSALPLVAVAPATAAVNPDLSDITLDCSDFDGYDYWDVPLYGDSVTITLINCETNNLYDFANSGTATVDSGTLDDNGLLEVDESPEVVTITGEAEFEVWDVDSESNGYDIYFTFYEPYEMPDPSGGQLEDTSKVIAASDPLVTTYGTSAEIDLGDEIGIGGDTEVCGIIPGEHVYTTQDINVSVAGEYTFRVTGVDPMTYYFRPFEDESSPFRDPMVALYTSFDPTNPDANHVSCNDDLNDLEFGDHDYADNDFNITQQGDYVEGHFPYFTANLEPGNYTMVFTTWASISASEWSDGEADSGDYIWTPADHTVYYDIWGPTNGLTLGHKLAETGVDASFGLWTGLALVGTGAAIAVARRRAVRA
ncbi:MAG: hypothetical protein ACKOWN_03855 [Microbacteriaceae bacterium]